MAAVLMCAILGFTLICLLSSAAAFSLIRSNLLPLTVHGIACRAVINFSLPDGSPDEVFDVTGLT
jgi:hypothetical protein